MRARSPCKEGTGLGCSSSKRGKTAGLIRLAAFCLALTLAFQWQTAGAQGRAGSREKAPKAVAKDTREWVLLKNDGIHDPRAPAVKNGVLQEPGEALGALTPGDPEIGNQVRWVGAVDSGALNPRTNIRPESKFKVLDQDVFLNVGGGMPVVRFPHREHTVWLDCKSCHEELFKSKSGATRFSMETILQGEQCGVCHGAVSFPLTECGRCHVISQNAFDPVSMRPREPYDRKAPFSPVNLDSVDPSKRKAGGR